MENFYLPNQNDAIAHASAYGWLLWRHFGSFRPCDPNCSIQSNSEPVAAPIGNVK